MTTDELDSRLAELNEGFYHLISGYQALFSELLAMNLKLLGAIEEYRRINSGREVTARQEPLIPTSDSILSEEFIPERRIAERRKYQREIVCKKCKQPAIVEKQFAKLCDGCRLVIMTNRGKALRDKKKEEENVESGV